MKLWAHIGIKRNDPWQEVVDFNLDWYVWRGPIIEATDRIVDDAINIALSVLQGKASGSTIVPDIPALGVVFQEDSQLNYDMPLSLLGWHKKGIYGSFSAIHPINGLDMQFLSYVYDVKLISNIAKDWKNSQDKRMAAELFWFGLLQLPVIQNPCFTFDKNDPKAWHDLF